MTDIPTQAPSVEQRLRAMADIRIFNATTFREAREIMRLAADELAERTQAPTDSAVEPAGVSEERLRAIDSGRVKSGHALATEREIRHMARECIAARQELAATRTQLAAREAECRVKERALTSLSKQLADSAHEVERLNAENAAMRGALEEIERICLADNSPAPLADVIQGIATSVLSASPSQPSRGKCETCNGRQRILQPISKTARNPVKPDELVRVQTFVPCPDCAEDK